MYYEIIIYNLHFLAAALNYNFPIILEFTSMVINKQELSITDQLKNSQVRVRGELIINSCRT